MKTKIRLATFASLLLLVAPCLAKVQAIREFDIKTIEKLGTEIYQRDKYAARATDIVFEKVGGPDKLAEEKVLGWFVSRKKGNKYLVRFVRQAEKGLLPAYDVVFSTASGKSAFRKASGELTSEELAKFNARQSALDAVPEFFTPRSNTVVLPDVDHDGFLVYVIATTTDPDVVLVGGVYRITVSADGKTVEAVDKLSNSLVTMEKPKPQKEKVGHLFKGKVAAMFITHVISPTPLESHVFASLLYKTPLYVATKDKTFWYVENGVISNRGKL